VRHAVTVPLSTAVEDTVSARDFQRPTVKWLGSSRLSKNYRDPDHSSDDEWFLNSEFSQELWRLEFLSIAMRYHYVRTCLSLSRVNYVNNETQRITRGVARHCRPAANFTRLRCSLAGVGRACDQAPPRRKMARRATFWVSPFFSLPSVLPSFSHEPVIPSARSAATDSTRRLSSSRLQQVAVGA